MSDLSKGFYVIGGSLHSDTPSYVERGADAELYKALINGEFCYILTARQMGKSSLMARTTARLRQSDVNVAILDLTAVGRNLTAEQWYFSLLGLVGEQFDIESRLEAYWQQHDRQGPLRRFMGALSTEILTLCSGQIVVFVDEIDIVRSLPFDTDEFFAAIRECYNRRSDDHNLERLTFCLLGVASPSDLIRDTLLTPFNIGRRIELSDFMLDEASTLTAGFTHSQQTNTQASASTNIEPSYDVNGAALYSPIPKQRSARYAVVMQRILYWTGGHPYLTQRLCLESARYLQGSQDGPERSINRADVDRICADLFFSHGAAERDDNLVFVRERIMHDGQDLAAMLDLYRLVLGGRRVQHNETNSLMSALMLAGIVRFVHGELRVRNRIYERVFDREWVLAHMPGAEIRRQRAAFRRGVAISGVISIVIILAISTLAGFAIKYERIATTANNKANRATATANRKATEADLERANAVTARMSALKETKNALQASMREANQRNAALRLAAEANAARSSAARAKAEALIKAQEANRNLYLADMSLIQREWAGTNVNRVRQLLEETRAYGSHTFEWRYWHRITGIPLMRLAGHTNVLFAIAYSPDGNYIVTGSKDKTARVWNAHTGKQVVALSGHSESVNSVCFTINGKRVVTGSWDKTARVWDVRTGNEVMRLQGHTGAIYSVAVSPDGKSIATASADGTTRIWDSTTGNQTRVIGGNHGDVRSVAFSQNGRYIATGSSETTLFDALSGTPIRSWPEDKGDVCSVAFSPDSRWLGIGGTNKGVHVLNLETGAAELSYNHDSGVTSIAFSSDNRHLVSSSWDGTAQTWDISTHSLENLLRGHSLAVMGACFSPDGKRVATAGYDRVALIWDAMKYHENMRLRVPYEAAMHVAVSHDGNWLALGDSHGNVRILNSVTGEIQRTTKIHFGMITSISFSEDGSNILTSSWDRTAKLWDLRTGRIVVNLGSHPDRLEYACMSPNGALAVTACDDGSARLWDLSNGQLLRTLKAHDGKVNGCALSPDGSRFATAGADGTAKVWDTNSGRLLHTFTTGKDIVRTVSFSPNGSLLVSGADDRVARLWDVRSGALVRSMQGHLNFITATGFSRDGSRIMTASLDRTVRLWDTATGREALMLDTTDPTYSAAFFPDNKRIVSGGIGTIATVWLSD